MTVKVGNTLSTPTNVTGGAVQRIVLGVLDHNAVMEWVDADFVSSSHKYVDDMTTTEFISRNATGGRREGENALESFYLAGRKLDQKYGVLKGTKQQK